MAIALNTFSNVNFLGTNNLSVYTTNAGGTGAGAFLPADNALVISFFVTSETADAGECRWNEGSPYAFTQVSGSPFTAEGTGVPRKLYVAHAQRSTWGVTAQTLSWDVTGDAATGGSIRIIELTGVDVDTAGNGAGALVQQQSASNQTSANPALTLSSLTGSDDAVVACFVNDVNPFAGAAEAGWTENIDTGYNTPTTGHAIYSRLATTDNTVVVTRAATDWGGWAAEIKVAEATVDAYIHYPNRSIYV